MSTAFRFLVLDDDADTAFLNRHALEDAFPDCVVVEASHCEEALVLLQRGPAFDALLSDHHLRGTSGGECVARMRRLGIACPILLVTNSDDPSIHAEAHAAGASAVFSPRHPDFVGYLKTVLPPA